MSLADEIAAKHKLKVEALPPEPTATPGAAPEPSPAETFGKVAMNETSFGGSPGATARGAWLSSMFGPKDPEGIPREYAAGSQQADVENSVRTDLANQERVNPRAALGGKAAAMIDHAVAASALPMAGFGQAVGTGAALGAGEGATRAYNANEDVTQGAVRGGLQGAVAGGVLQQAAPAVGMAGGWVPRMFGGASRALRGRQIAGTGANLEKSAADLRRAGIPETMPGVGQAAEDVGLPSATSVRPMSPKDYEHAAQDVRSVEKANTDAAVRAASADAAGEQLPPEALRRQATMLPPPSGAAEALGASTQALPAKMPAMRAKTVTLEHPRLGESEATVPERVPENTAASAARTGRPRGKVSKAEVAKALADLRSGAAGRIDPDAAALERVAGRMEKRLEGQPENMTPEQALAIRRGLDKASGFRPGEVVVPGGKEGVQSAGHAVREQLRTAMSETPHGEAFNASQARASKAAALQELAKRHAAKALHSSLGTGATAAMLSGGLHAAHGALDAAHAAPGAGALTTAALAGGAAALGRHYGADIAATAAKGAEKLTSPLANPEVLTPGQTASTLDIWAVKEKRKNETDPNYRKQQRRKAAAESE